MNESIPLPNGGEAEKSSLGTGIQQQFVDPISDSWDYSLVEYNE